MSMMKELYVKGTSTLVESRSVLNGKALFVARGAPGGHFLLPWMAKHEL